MTATIKPPNPRIGKPARPRQPLRFSSMETLGFADASSVWSEAPRAETRRGRHETLVADLRPEEVGNRLSGSNIRWSLVALVVLILGGLAGAGYWINQSPSMQTQSAIIEVVSGAEALGEALPSLEVFNDTLPITESVGGIGELFEVEAEARALFNSSGSLPEAETEMRLASSQAASSALDAVRLASGARSFRSAVTPVLERPALETDPALIGLDEAARSFGEWQMSFDAARTAVSSNILPVIGEQLDILSADLSSFLSRYVDAVRLDDRREAEAVLSDLGSRLEAIETALTDALVHVQARVEERIAETRQALERLSTG